MQQKSVLHRALLRNKPSDVPNKPWASDTPQQKSVNLYQQGMFRRSSEVLVTWSLLRNKPPSIVPNKPKTTDTPRSRSKNSF